MEDCELLTAYVRHRSEEAFTALVKRYVNLVYSTALRQLHSPDQAQDATQAVFLILARKAGSIPRAAVLSGWLYRTARYVAMEAMRAEKRRKIRETIMAEQTERDKTESTEFAWSQIAAHVDRSMEQLSGPDRDAILLRYFEGKSIREISVTLGIGEEAAKKRVGRALERLRGCLAQHGIKNSSTVLGAALTTYAIQPAPTAMAAAIPGLVCNGTAG
jgi:RNA polymerase sigma factor (sigma-70 family)